jgi:S13-like H2TH domain
MPRSASISVESPRMSPAAPSSPTTTSGRSGAPPERSFAQQMDALQRANEVRSARAQLKRELKVGRVHIHGVLLDPPEYLQNAKVSELLLSVPKYGRVKVNRLLTQCRISPSKTLGGLSERQRHELVANLRR